MKVIQQMRLAATLIIVLAFIAIPIAGMCDNANAAESKAPEVSEALEPTAVRDKNIPTYVVEAAQPADEALFTQPVEEEPKKEYVYYDVPLDDSFQEYIQDVCEQYSFDRYDIIIALIERESNFREDVISSTDDYGLMQINEINHERLSEELGITDFLDGEQNVLAGVYILSNLYNKYEDIGLALMAYNCGENGARHLWEQGIYSTKYSERILSSVENLEVRI